LLSSKDREAAEKFIEETEKLGYRLYACRYLLQENLSRYKVMLVQEQQAAADSSGLLK